MITKEAIEAGCAAIDRPIHPDDVERILTAAFAAMPGPVVKVKPLEWESVMSLTGAEWWCAKNPIRGHLPYEATNTEERARKEKQHVAWVSEALTPAPDLAAENERLRAALAAAKSEFDVISCEGVTETKSLHDAFDRMKMFADRGASSARAALEDRT